MSDAHRRAKALTPVALVGAFLWGMSDASAVRIIAITSNPMEVEVLFHPSRAVQLHLPERIRFLHWGNGDDFAIERANPTVVTINATNPASSNLIIQTWSHRFVVNLVPAPEHEIEAIIDFIEPKNNDIAESLRPISEEERHRITLLHKLREEKLVHARNIVWAADSHRIVAALGNVSEGDKYVSFVARIRNIGKYDYPIQELRVHDVSMTTSRVIVEVADTPDHELPSSLIRGEELLIAVMVRRSASLRPGWALQLFPGDSMAPATFHWKDDASRRPRPLDRLSLGVEGRGGVAQFTRAGASEFSSARSIGLRARYGFARLFALEGMLSYVDTGDATFDDGSMGITGARAQVSAVLTLGDRYAPFVRVGFGALPASVRTDGFKDFRLLRRTPLSRQ